MPIKKLTASEEIVMKAVWNCPESPTLSHVLDKTTTMFEKDWKPQTISTFLKKLVNKKYLKMHHIQGHIYIYQILISEFEYRKMLYAHLIHFWYNDDTIAFLLEMVKNGDLPKEEIYKNFCEDKN